MKGTISMNLYQFLHNCDLDSQTKESKALIPSSIKNLVLESLATWVTIDTDGSKILNLQVSFWFWIN